MSDKPNKFGSSVPEMREFIDKYGCKLKDNPHYVLIGKYKSEAMGPVHGILAAANNEFHAHILRREFNKSGLVSVQKTEYHPVQSEDISERFSIEAYKDQFRKHQERLRKSAQER